MILFFYFVNLLIKYLVSIFWNVIKIFFLQVDLVKRYSENKYETWAVVTGATDGIGLGFVEELLSKGFNVCLVSRNQ